MFIEHKEHKRASGAEPVEGAALALEGVDHVHGGHRLAAGVLGVGHRVADHVLEEHLEHRARLLVDEAPDALDTATASQTADRGLGDALDVVALHLAVALGAALAEALAALAASGHSVSMSVRGACSLIYPQPRPSAPVPTASVRAAFAPPAHAVYKRKHGTCAA